MYFIARKISLPTIEVLMKKEKTEDVDQLYRGFTKEVNSLINKYFNISDEGKIIEILTLFLYRGHGNSDCRRQRRKSYNDTTDIH